MRILVATHESHSAFFLSLAPAYSGCEFVIARSYWEALAGIASEESVPDYVLVHIRLPLAYDPDADISKDWDTKWANLVVENCKERAVPVAVFSGTDDRMSKGQREGFGALYDVTWNGPLERLTDFLSGLRDRERGPSAR